MIRRARAAALRGLQLISTELPLEVSSDYQAPVSALDGRADTWPLTMHWLYRGGHAEESGWARDT